MPTPRALAAAWRQVPSPGCRCPLVLYRRGTGTSADTGTKAGTFTASDEWIGRAVYSSDGKELGKVASVQQNDLNADLGGFLGIGATRTLIKADQIQDVKDDRIVLRLTEAEAKNLPAAEEKSPQQ